MLEHFFCLNWKYLSVLKLGSNIDVAKELVNGSIANLTKIYSTTCVLSFTLQLKGGSNRLFPVSTVPEIQGATVDKAAIFFGFKLFAAGQVNVDCSKLTSKKPCNVDILNEMNPMRTITNELNK